MLVYQGPGLPTSLPVLAILVTSCPVVAWDTICMLKSLMKPSPCAQTCVLTIYKRLPLWYLIGISNLLHLKPNLSLLLSRPLVAPLAFCFPGPPFSGSGLDCNHDSSFLLLIPPNLITNLSAQHIQKYILKITIHASTAVSRPTDQDCLWCCWSLLMNSLVLSCFLLQSVKTVALEGKSDPIRPNNPPDLFHLWVKAISLSVAIWGQDLIACHSQTSSADFPVLAGWGQLTSQCYLLK